MLMGCATAAQGQPIDMLVYPVAGIFDADPTGAMTGPGVRILARLEAISGVEFRRQMLPPARVIRSLRTEPRSCAAGVPRLAERDAQMHWAGIIAIGRMMLYGRPDETRSIASVDDLRGSVIVARRDSAPAAWLRDKGLEVHEVRDTATGLRMLLGRRVDYWLVNELSVRQELGALPAQQLPRPLREFGRIEAYIACHLDTPAATLLRLQSAIEQLRRDGELLAFGVR